LRISEKISKPEVYDVPYRTLSFLIPAVWEEEDYAVSLLPESRDPPVAFHLEDGSPDVDPEVLAYKILVVAA